jgi:hypothetical protein
MNLITREIRWKTWEFGLAKLGFILSGVILGALRPALFRPRLGLLGGLAVGLLAWPVVAWMRGFGRD